MSMSGTYATQSVSGRFIKLCLQYKLHLHNCDENSMVSLLELESQILGCSDANPRVYA